MSRAAAAGSQASRAEEQKARVKARNIDDGAYADTLVFGFFNLRNFHLDSELSLFFHIRYLIIIHPLNITYFKGNYCDSVFVQA